MEVDLLDQQVQQDQQVAALQQGNVDVEQGQEAALADLHPVGLHREIVLLVRVP